MKEVLSAIWILSFVGCPGIPIVVLPQDFIAKLAAFVRT
jgi:hypothetical protein